MSTSSSTEYARTFTLPIAVLQYRDMSPEQPMPDGGEKEAAERQSGAGISEKDLATRLQSERAEAARELEQRLRREYEQKLLAARAPIAAAVAAFDAQRNDYFARVEAEVIQLALAIAAKILHREAQVDPMLVAALVRVAVEKIREGSSVTVRVSLGRGESWKRYFSEIASMSHVEVIEDPQVGDQDCLVETELGSAQFGLDAQLKEIQQGFFDLLALRPAER